MTRWLSELRARLQVGGATLLLGIVEDEVVLDATRRLLSELLQATPLAVVDLGESARDAGPRRWAEQTQGRPGDAYVLSAAPASPLGLCPMVVLYNTERELLRQLAGPLVLLVSRTTEKEIRRTSPDFITWAAWIYELPSQRELTELAAQAGVAPERVTPAEPLEEPIRFLHVSDLHLRPQRVKRYDQDRVLRGLVDRLASDRATFPLDAVFVTGDLAHSGKPDEYALVVELLRGLMEVTSVPAERVFVVPGNHDVDREVGRWVLRTLAGDDDATAFFAEAKHRVAHARKLQAYRESMAATLGEGRPLGLSVGEEAVEVLEVRGARVAVASFNSAWFAQGDDDHGKLWLGEPNVNHAGQRVADLETSFAIALLHHPLGDLHDLERDNVEHYLERSFDLVMRGHLHKDKTRAIATQRGGYVEVAGPAAYQGSQWPNGCFLGELRPRARKVRLRPYAYASPTDAWVLDTKVFPDDERDGYCPTFTVPEKRRLKSAVTQGIEQAVKAAVRRASPAEQRKMAEQLGVAGPGEELTAELATKLALAGAGDLAFTEYALSPKALGVTLGQAGAGELAKQAPISRDEPKFLELSLSRIAEPLGRALRAAGVHAGLLETTVTWMLHAMLSVVFGRPPGGPSLAVQPLLPDGRRPDILIGSLGEPPQHLAVIEIMRQDRPLNAALAQLDGYLETSGAVHGALVLYDPRTPSRVVPQLEHVTTPAGRDVVLLRL